MLKIPGFESGMAGTPQPSGGLPHEPVYLRQRAQILKSSVKKLPRVLKQPYTYNNELKEDIVTNNFRMLNVLFKSLKQLAWKSGEES